MENFDNLKKTPLFEKHCALGGKIVDFGGWALPVQYTSILDECKAVRERAGLFDVSHMGEVDIIGNDAYAYMQKMVTNDVTSMTPGRCRYAVMCYDNGRRSLHAHRQRRQYRQGLCMAFRTCIR